MSTAAKNKAPPAKGRTAVEEALISAACKMLAERGPRAMSVRNVATAAGVNHGQVHHYFGGKRGLIMAAVLRLARDHFEHANKRAGDNPVPPPLSLGQDTDYWQALVRLILDNDLEAATAEINEGISIPRQVIQSFTGRESPADAPLKVRSLFAAIIAVELGWASLEPYALMMSGIEPEDTERARDYARQMVGLLYNHFDEVTANMKD